MTAETVRRRRLLTISAVALVLLVAALAAWVIIRGVLAKSALESAVDDTDRIVSAMNDGDLDAAQTALTDLRDHSASAAALTGDPLWGALQAVPALGPNLRAVSVVSAQLHALADDVAAPLLTLARDLEGGDSAGLLDLDALRAAAPDLQKAKTTLSDAQEAVADLNPEGLVGPLQDGVVTLDSALTAALPAVGAVADGATVLPGLLGADEERSLLVMVQNNAELRTGGGISGTFLELVASDGQVRIARHADSSTFAPDPAGNPDVPASTIELYGDAAAEYVMNISMSPDFEATAAQATSWWESVYHDTPDAVVSVDPFVLKALLTTTGPVPTSRGPLTADNLVSTLLIEPYLTLTAQEQTGVFQEAADAVFSTLTDGSADPVALVRSLVPVIDAGRISLWSAHEDEQDVLAQGALAGPAARQRQAGDDAYAVYFNDRTGGKMDTLLDTAITAETASCTAESRSRTTLTVTLTNRTDPADVPGYPLSMTGGGEWGVEPGVIDTVVTVSAPMDAYYGGVSVDGGQVGPVDTVDAGFPVSATSVALDPGQSKDVVFTFLTEGDEAGTPTILHTPLVHAPEVTVRAGVCD